MKETKQEFLELMADRRDLTVVALRDHGLGAKRCNCDFQADEHWRLCDIDDEDDDERVTVSASGRGDYNDLNSAIDAGRKIIKVKR